MRQFSLIAGTQFPLRATRVPGGGGVASLTLEICNKNSKLFYDLFYVVQPLDFYCWYLAVFGSARRVVGYTRENSHVGSSEKHKYFLGIFTAT